MNRAEFLRRCDAMGVGAATLMLEHSPNYLWAQSAGHCPTGAVRMIVGETGLPEPVFTTSICIGSGACHHACPVSPAKAISVSGLAEPF